MATPPPLPSQTRKDRGWRTWVAITAAVLAAILIFQNVQEVEVRFLFAETTTPLVLALLITFGLGCLAGWLAPRVRRTKNVVAVKDDKD